MPHSPLWVHAPMIGLRPTTSLQKALAFSWRDQVLSDDESSFTCQLSGLPLDTFTCALKTPSGCPTHPGSHQSYSDNEDSVPRELESNFHDVDEDLYRSDGSASFTWSLRRRRRSPKISEYFRFRRYPTDRFRQQFTIAPALHGDVRSVLDTCSERKVIMKVVRREAVQEGAELENPRKEICVNNYLRSNDTATPPLFTVKSLGTYADDTHFYLVQENCEGGELYQLLRNKKHLSEKSAKRIALQLVFALITLHLNGLCHRDVSLENVLLTQDGSVRLIDFGQADALYDRNGNPNLLLGPAGKAYYRAPEMYIGPYLGAPVDVFALGVVIFLLVTGTPPWREATPGDERYQVISSSPEGLSRAFDQWGWRRPTPVLEDLLTSIFYKPASLRPTLDEILRHQWFTEDATPWRECRQLYPQSDLIRNKMRQTRAQSLRQRRLLESSPTGGETQPLSFSNEWNNNGSRRLRGPHSRAAMDFSPSNSHPHIDTLYQANARLRKPLDCHRHRRGADVSVSGILTATRDNDVGPAVLLHTLTGC